MKATWDPDVDAFYLELSRGKAVDSEEIQPGVILDYGRGDTIVGIEILDFSRKVKKYKLMDKAWANAVAAVPLETLKSRPSRQNRKALRSRSTTR